MEYFRKKFRRSRRALENFEEPGPYDRLSNLPDDILHHILSYLDNTEVIKTSLLARKWRDIWYSVPCLNFDLREFWKQDRLNYGECVSKFWLFIKRSILIRKVPTICRVRLLCDYFDGYQLELLLFICAVRKVQEIYISAGYGMQHCQLYCARPENVESIAANMRYLLDMEPWTGLWNVKTLHLVGVRFPDGNITQRLFGDCGVLENLSIESCCFLTVKSLKICTNKLRKLNFVNCGLGLYGRKCIFGGQLELHTPNLESFCYTGPAIRFSESSDMPFLKNVSVLLRREFLHPRVPSVHICTMVSAIHHVENLSLSAVFLLYYSAAIVRSRRKFTPFDDLRHLKLDLECNPDCFEGLIHVLQHSPNLEALSIELNGAWPVTSWKSREVYVPCLSHYVKEIEILEFCDSPNWFELIKFFLQNGKSLERIKVTHKRQKVKLEKFYALQEVQVASEAVSVSIASKSASAKKESVQLVYGKCGWSVQTKTSKTKIRLRRSVRIAAKKKSGGSS